MALWDGRGGVGGGGEMAEGTAAVTGTVVVGHWNICPIAPGVQTALRGAGLVKGRRQLNIHHTKMAGYIEVCE